MAGLERIQTASSMAEMFARMTGKTIGELLSLSARSEKEQLEDFFLSRAKNYNESEGFLTGFDCSFCKNRGDFMMYDRGSQSTSVKFCKCREIRRRIVLLVASGLGDRLDAYTFENFIVKEDWQKNIKETAMRFVEDNHGHWFYIGGQVGAGKTHICTAIAGKLLRNGLPTKYMLWRDEAVKIKQFINNEEEYGRLVEDIKTVKVLYIDDFFKVKQGEQPTAGDVNLAFEILNYRYCKNDLITIISSEHDTDRLLDFDEAVGSRIYERSKKYALRISNDRKKNQRMNDFIKPATSSKADEQYWWQK